MVTAATIESERETIYNEAVETVTAKAAVADVVGIQDNLDGLRRRYRRTMICMLGTMFLLLSIVAVALVQTSRQRSNKQAVTDASASASAPSLPFTSAPTEFQDGVFRTTMELYEAVDAYLIAATTSDEPEASEVAKHYGYPMGRWNVSLITNFTRVFDPDRYVPFDPMRTSSYSPFNEDLRGWDVSNAVTMFGMFVGATEFVGNGLVDWDVGKVEDFSFVFMKCVKFNGVLAHWNTSRAKKMDGMFAQAVVFEGDVSSWDVSSVTSMSNMFSFTEKFTGPNLSRWNVSHVQSMNSMFQFSESFRGNISSWDTRKVTDMSQMFMEASSFNDDLSSWSVGKVIDMSRMLAAPSFQGGNLTAWDTSHLTNVMGMFGGAVSFTGDISTWNVSNVKVFSYLFFECAQFNGDISKWDTSRAEAMPGMFVNAKKFNGDISMWDISRVTVMKEMFFGAESFNGNISGWNVSSVQDASIMLSRASSFNQNLCSWRSRLPLKADVRSMFEFSGCENTDDPVMGAVGSTHFCSYCDDV